LLLLLAAAGFAAAGEPVLEVAVPRVPLEVGDRVTARLVARGEEGLLWGEPSVVVEPDGPWELVDGPRAVAGSEPPTWELTLVAMKVGELPVPPVEVTVRPPAGEPLRVSAVALPTVAVASVLEAQDAGDPAPLKDPVGARGFPWEWVLPGLAAGLPVAVVLALYLRRRRRPVGGEAAAPALPPLEELEALVAALRSGVGRETEDVVCDRLAAGMRRFLERRTGEPALEMTSAELRVLARQRGWPEGVQRSVQSVMGVADGVRFGRRAAGEGSLRQAVEGALMAGRELEEHLTPAPGEASEAAG
jgi:hypothetical protein